MMELEIPVVVSPPRSVGLNICLYTKKSSQEGFQVRDYTIWVEHKPDTLQTAGKTIHITLSHLPQTQAAQCRETPLLMEGKDEMSIDLPPNPGAQQPK